MDPRPGADASHSVALQSAELVARSVRAANGDDDDAALDLLERSVMMCHVNPAAHYLLGAEYAQRKRLGDAVVHFTTAVEQDPQMFTASLQLGLLWMILSNPNAAVTSLGALAHLPEADPLRWFAEGLMALCRNELGLAEHQLRKGLALPSANAALCADMERVVAAIRKASEDAAAAAVPLALDNPSPPAALGLAISAYLGRSTS